MKAKTTIKIWTDTRRKLRLLAVMLDKSMMQCFDDLVSEALEKQKEKETKDGK